MSIGYGSIGEFAIGEFGNSPAIVEVGSVVGTVSVQMLAPTISVGASISPSPMSIQFVGVSPVVLTDVVIETPTLSPKIAFSLLAPQVLHSVNLTVPTMIVGFNTNTPRVSGGSSVLVNQSMPPITMRVGGNPIVRTGVLVDAPSMSIGTRMNVPTDVTHSVNLLVPSMVFGFAMNKPDFGGGAVIDVSNTVVTVSYAGGIGDSSIGEFSIGEGPPLALTTKETMRIRFAMNTATVQAGKLVDASPVSIFMAMRSPEIGARRRKLRVSAIAS